VAPGCRAGRQEDRVEATVPIRDRKLLLAAIGVAGGAALLMAFGLWDLGQRRANAPAVVAVEKSVLADALEDSPWVSSGKEGPILWVVTSPDCGRCRAFEKQVLPGLLDKGVEARVIVVAARDKPMPADQAEAVAAVAKRRDWVALQTWMSSQRNGDRLNSADTDGYLEWGRASYDRIGRALARNGVDLAAPSMFWKVGPEWRASVKPDGRALAYMRDDLTEH
jgi:hypothetical protein